MNVKAINEFSCALACITSLLSQVGETVQQEGIVTKFSNCFPDWQFRKGLLSQGGMLTLLELFDFRIGYVLLTEDQKEFLEAFGKLSNHNRYLASFLLTTKPTAHCRSHRVGLTFCGVHYIGKTASQSHKPLGSK